MISSSFKKRLFVVDDFYSDPYSIREQALSVDYLPDLRYYKGSRSTKQHIVPGTKEAFESIIGEKIKVFYEYEMCGRFQICTSEDPVVYHCDQQTWAGMIYLSPDAPYECGTSLLSAKVSKIRDGRDPNVGSAFAGGFYDKTRFDVVDVVGNVFNRLVIFDSRCIHAACQYFGKDNLTGRLTHLFFFD